MFWERIALILIVALTAWPAALSATDIGTAQKVVGKVWGGRLAYPIEEGRGLPYEEVVQTTQKSATVIRFLDNTRFAIGENAEVVLDKFVYDPAANVLTGSVDLARGLFRYVGGKGSKQDVTIATRSATLGIRGTVFDLYVTPAGTELSVSEGAVLVTSAAGTMTVPAGSTVRMGPAQAPIRLPSMSAEMASAVAEAQRLTGPVERETKLASATPSAAPAATQAARDLLVLSLATGDVVIRLRPDLAPGHVTRLGEWVDRGRYDGLGFATVIKGAIAETEIPRGQGESFAAGLAKEASQTRFTRGSVGMVPARNAAGSDGRLFVAFALDQHLDGRFPLVGDVIQGLTLLEQLPPGTPPRTPARVLRGRMTAER